MGFTPLGPVSSWRPGRGGRDPLGQAYEVEPEANVKPRVPFTDFSEVLIPQDRIARGPPAACAHKSFMRVQLRSQIRRLATGPRHAHGVLLTVTESVGDGRFWTSRALLGLRNLDRGRPFSAESGPSTPRYDARTAVPSPAAAPEGHPA